MTLERCEGEMTSRPPRPVRCVWPPRPAVAAHELEILALPHGGLASAEPDVSPESVTMCCRRGGQGGSEYMTGTDAIRHRASETALDVDEMVIGTVRRLAEAYLAQLPRRWAHTIGVAEAADRLSLVLPVVMRPAAVAGAWLHDVGYAPSIAATGFHPLDGARFLREQGLPCVVVALVAHHTGAGVEADERGMSEELAQIPTPPRRLLDVLTCADLTTGPTGRPVRAQERIAEILTRYPPGHPVHRAVTRSEPDLLAAVERVQRRAASIKTAGIETAGTARRDNQRPARPAPPPHR